MYVFNILLELVIKN